MTNAQQKALEETSKVALDAADAAARAAEEIHSVTKEYDKLLTSNRRVLRGLSAALLSAAIGVILAVGLSSLVYYKSRADFLKSNDMLMQAVAVFAENVDELTLAQKNIDSMISAQTELQNEVGLARKSLDTIPPEIKTALSEILPEVSEVLQKSSQETTEQVATITETSLAGVAQQLNVIYTDLQTLESKLNEVRTTETLQDEKASEVRPDYNFVNVQSDLEQMLLLQKELSAKITMLQDALKPKKVLTKTTKRTTKPTSPKPNNPLKFP